MRRKCILKEEMKFEYHGGENLKKFIVEFGMGTDFHGQDVTKAAKKAGASAERGGFGSNKPADAVPQSAAPKNSVVVAPGRHVPKISFTHEKNAYTPDNGDKYIAQLNGFLKNGIIERSEYNYLLKKYRNNYTK